MKRYGALWEMRFTGLQQDHLSTLTSYRINTQIILVPSLHSLGRSTNQWETVIIVGWPPNRGERNYCLPVARGYLPTLYHVLPLPLPSPHTAYHIHPPSNLSAYLNTSLHFHHLILLPSPRLAHTLFPPAHLPSQFSSHPVFQLPSNLI